MSTPYVTFPGTAGNYVSTADVNLLGADTAHCYQSRGLWQGAYAAAAANADAWSGYAIRVVSATGTRVFTTTTNIAVSASTQYAMGVTVDAEGISDLSLRFEYYNGGAANGSAYLTGSDVNSVPANTPTRIEGYATTPAGTDSIRISVYVQAEGGGTPAFAFDLYDIVVRTGSDGSFVPSLRIVGDLDLRAKLAADDWTPSAVQILLDEYVAGTGGYRLGIETSGAISLVAHGATGAISELSSGFTLVDGATTEIRVTMDASAGDLTWYQDGTEVDDDTYTAQALKAAGLDLYVGALSSDASHFAGNIYWVEIRDGIDGPVVRRFDAADVAGQLT